MMRIMKSKLILLRDYGDDEMLVRRYLVTLLGLLLLTISLLHATQKQYPPILRNDINTSEYHWNALESRWLNIRALAMIGLDASSFHQDRNNRLQVGDLKNYNRADVRGIRLGVAGSINFDRPWTYLVSGSINSLVHDFNATTDDRYTLFDLLIGIPVWGEYGRIQIGKMKEPISMERTMGMVFEQVMERPMHLDALLPSRNTGISIGDLIARKYMTWRVGVYSRFFEHSGRTWSGANRQIVGRITAVPYEEKRQQRLFHLGAAYRYEDIRQKKIRYDVGPEQYFVDDWLDTGEFLADASNTLNIEMSYLDGPLWLASEFTATAVDAPQSGDPVFKGYHVVANYFITGEHRGYNYRRGTVRRITPVLDFTNGGWGAVEVSARYSYMDLDDQAIHGGEMDITSVGVIWHPRRDVQFHMQWSYARLDKMLLDQNPLSIEKGTANILQFRVLLVID